MYQTDMYEGMLAETVTMSRRQRRLSSTPTSPDRWAPGPFPAWS